MAASLPRLVGELEEALRRLGIDLGHAEGYLLDVSRDADFVGELESIASLYTSAMRAGDIVVVG